MAKSTWIYLWDNSFQLSNNFSVTTKYYDLGDVSIDKTIYSISMTTGLQSNTSSASQTPILAIYYRTSVGSGWTFYGAYAGADVGMYATGNISAETVINKKKLKKVPGIQLKIQGYCPEAFLINDISIEYRHLRKKAVGRPK